MCGLFGAHSSLLSTKERQLVAQLGVVSTLRGIHSTGIAKSTKSNGVLFKKSMQNALNFCINEKNREFFSLDHIQKGPIEVTHTLMGHTRYATLGAINKCNAHPHQHGHIIGAHNGTIQKFQPISSRENEWSDSKELFDRISNFGLEETLREARDGAWAITWFNEEDNTFNMVRNHKRTLYIAYDERMSTMYWASEKQMLELVLDRNNIKMSKQGAYMVPPLVHLSFEKDSLKYKRKDIDLYPTVKYTYNNKITTIKDNDNSVIIAHDLTKKSPSTSVPTVKPLSMKPLSKRAQKKQHKRKQKLSATTYYMYWDGLIIPAQYAQAKLDKGCSCCKSKRIKPEHEVHWLSAQHFICDTCYEDDFFGEYYRKDETHMSVLLSKEEFDRINTITEDLNADVHKDS